MLNLTRYATGCRLRNWMPVVQLDNRLCNCLSSCTAGHTLLPG